MKICFAILLFLLVVSCGSQPKPVAVVIPADADFKTDVLIKRTDEGRSVEITFFYTRPVAPGTKTDEGVVSVPVEDAQYTGKPLTATTNEAGRTVYIIKDVPVTAESTVSARVNGKLYEAKLVPQTTLNNKSVTAVMVPK